MYDSSLYKLHVFSLHPSLIARNELTEEEVTNAVLDLDRAWHRETGHEQQFDPEDKKETIYKQLREENGVIINSDRRKGRICLTK
jgi:hypothetical protein